MKQRFLLAEDTIDQNDIHELIEWLRTNPWLTKGSLTEEFETQCARWLGVKYATFVNSGSSANLLMYYAAFLSKRLKNRKILVPAVSWATTVAPAIQLGFQPIMCDADWNTFGIDVDQLGDLLRKHNPGAVIIVHTLGVPNVMEPILELKEKFGFCLLEDCCPAHGARYQGRLVGTFGEMSSFSFFFGHHLSTIEGGMICTNDEELHDILLQIRSHGWGKDLAPEKESQKARDHGVIEFNRPFTFYYPGFNVRSTDLNARIGLLQMKKIDRVLERRIRNHRIYQSRFMTVPGFHVQRNDRATICSISFVALASSREHRERIGQALRANEIETRPLGGGSMGRQPFWTERYGIQPLPVADAIHERSFMLPNHHTLEPADINLVCDVVFSVQ